MCVDGLLRDLGEDGDVVDRRAGVAPGEEQRSGGIEDGGVFRR
jgi:hypothetical protein